MSDTHLEQGRRIVTGVIGAMLVSAVWVIVLYVVTRGLDRIFAQLLRLFFTGLLAFALYRGDVWARWTIVVLMFAAGVMGVANGALLSVALAIVHLSLGIALSLPRSVGAFLASRRALRGRA